MVLEVKSKTALGEDGCDNKGLKGASRILKCSFFRSSCSAWVYSFYENTLNCAFFQIYVILKFFGKIINTNIIEEYKAINNMSFEEERQQKICI